MEEKKEEVTSLEELPANPAPVEVIKAEVADVKSPEVAKKKKSFPNRLIHEAVKKRICELFAGGKTWREIRELTGIHHSSILNAASKDPEFNLRFTESRRIADDEIEKSMWQRAKGMKVEEYRESTDSQGRVETQRLIRELPPDTEAGKFWLSKRRAANWADNQNAQGNQTLNVITISGKKVEIKK